MVGMGSAGAGRIEGGGGLLGSAVGEPMTVMNPGRDSLSRHETLHELGPGLAPPATDDAIPAGAGCVGES